MRNNYLNMQSFLSFILFLFNLILVNLIGKNKFIFKLISNFNEIGYYLQHYIFNLRKLIVKAKIYLLNHFLVYIHNFKNAHLLILSKHTIKYFDSFLYKLYF